MRRKLIRSGLLEKHSQRGLNERGPANAVIKAPGDSCTCRFFSFYVGQHRDHPARTGLPGAEENESRTAGQGEASCWQHPYGSSVGRLTLAACRRCVPVAVPCFTHLKYPHSLQGARGLPANLGQSYECPPGAKLSDAFAPPSPREPAWAPSSMGARTPRGLG